jgi:uncharacterized membrane protein YgcG
VYYELRVDILAATPQAQESHNNKNTSSDSAKESLGASGALLVCDMMFSYTILLYVILNLETRSKRANRAGRNNHARQLNLTNSEGGGGSSGCGRYECWKRTG